MSGMRSAMINLIGLFFLLGQSSAVCVEGDLIRSGGLTCKDKQGVLDVHNEYRKMVAIGKVRGQPQAADMLQMGWDDELAKEAQYWADRCVFAHTPDRELSRFTYGQNLAIRMSTDGSNSEPDFKSAIDSWFDEVNEHGYSGEYKPETGHYSQVIWGKSNLVGCGYSYYSKDSWFVKYYVCNYGPAGNIIGRPPYTYGQPNCNRTSGLTSSKEFPGLCKTKNLPGAC